MKALVVYESTAPGRRTRARPAMEGSRGSNEMTRRTGSLLAIALTAILILAGCGTGTRTPSAEPSASTPPPESAFASASEIPSSIASESATVAPSPTETGLETQPPSGLPPFACDTPAIEAVGAVDQAVITDVRVGQHADFDRVVFEFDQGRAGGPPGVPAYALRLAEPPLTQTPSGLPMSVPGSRVLEVVLQGGTKLDENSQPVYDGATRFDPNYPTLTALYEAGDFEAVSNWYIGLAKQPCLRVLTLDGPPRLVIDLQH